MIINFLGEIFYDDSDDDRSWWWPELHFWLAKELQSLKLILLICSTSTPTPSTPDLLHFQGNSERPPSCSTLHLGLRTFSLVSYFFVCLPGQPRATIWQKTTCEPCPFSDKFFFGHLCRFFCWLVRYWASVCPFLDDPPLLPTSLAHKSSAREGGSSFRRKDF